MGKFSLTWKLMGQSWELLKKDKELLIFPLISGILCLAVMASFIYPMVSNQLIIDREEGAIKIDEVKMYLLLFLYYFITYFIIVFFNSAIIAAARIRLRGGNPTVKDGINASMSMLPLIAAWALGRRHRCTGIYPHPAAR